MLINKCHILEIFVKIKDLDEKYEQRNMFIICQTCVAN